MGVTIAIPFYNAEKYLPDAIRSVFFQTYQDWELLLIDDGSTDSSLDIAKSLKDPRVRVFSDGENKKLATRLNEVVHLAKYEYIARMDADDLMDPNRIKVQLDFLEANKAFDLVSSGTYSILNDKNLVGVRGESYEGNVRVEDILFRKVLILHASILARKSWYFRNFYNEELKVGQDTYMWVQAASKGDLKIKIIGEPLYIYREEGNISKSKLLRAYRNQREYLSDFLVNNNLRRKYVLKSYFKTLFIMIFGSQKFLLNRRNSELTSTDYLRIKEIYKLISNQKVFEK